MKKAKGFTLVEIMIVVAIIGILIAIAVPGFIRARTTSRRNACQENQTKIDGAIQQYILDRNLNSALDVANANNASELVAGPLGDTADGILWGRAAGGNASYLKSPPACPANGIYSIIDDETSRVGETIECSLETAGPDFHFFPDGEHRYDSAQDTIVDGDNADAIADF